MGDFIRPFQSRFIFSSILGLPLDNLGKWEQWAHDALVNPEKADEAFSEMGAAVAQLLEQRAAEPLPEGDIVSALATARPGGREVGMVDRVKVLIAIIMGGLESSGTVLSGTIHHFATHPGDGRMRIVIDADHCQGHALCFASAPEIVDLDEQGYAFVRPEAVGIAPGTARRLAAQCPERAISLRD